MLAETDGTARFTDVTLRPRVTVSSSSSESLLVSLHEAAHEKCVIAQSLNFPVNCECVTIVRDKLDVQAALVG